MITNEQQKSDLKSGSSRTLKMIRHLDYVILLCQDISKMRHFYQHVLGFELYRDQFDGQWIELQVGSVLLTLRPRGLVQLKGKSYDGSAPTTSASVQLAFRVAPKEVDECYKALQKMKIEILDQPTDQPWAHRTLFFQDPENNLLEIYADL